MWSDVQRAFALPHQQATHLWRHRTSASTSPVTTHSATKNCTKKHFHAFMMAFRQQPDWYALNHRLEANQSEQDHAGNGQK